jgi:hypothetical protein
MTQDPGIELLKKILNVHYCTCHKKGKIHHPVQLFLVVSPTSAQIQRN